ncbi:MAG: hypothetical protein P8N31_13015 [Planctomycetota bacterium]|nr:hypothetical protein [Planctomycetota bacterium]MDG2144467.1 hypothetical protein [Planctomycetota bacterium]
MKETLPDDPKSTAPKHQPVPGDLWEFPLGPPELTGWAVIKRHPDDQDLLLVAPCDSQEAVGARDLAVPSASKDEATGRLVLRGDWTRWARRSDFWFRAGQDIVPREWRREFLARIQDGFGQPRHRGASLIREESTEWAGSSAWNRDVLIVADGDLDRWESRETAREELKASDPVTKTDDVRMELAAAGQSTLDEILGEDKGEDWIGDELDDEQVQELFHLFVTKGHAGRETRTYLHLTGSAAYFELDAELAPREAFVLGASGGRTFLRWTRTLSRRWRSQVVDLVSGGLRVVVAGDPVVDVEIGS